MELKVSYKVYIIESLSAVDIQTEKKYEGRILSEILMLQEISVEYSQIKDKTGFIEAIERIKMQILSQYQNIHINNSFTLPILHLSCHGNKDGIEFTDEFIKWDELYAVLLLLSDAFVDIDVDVNPLLLVMSVCEGLYALLLDEIAQKLSKKSPFAFLIANKEKIYWEDTIVAFSVLYYNLILRDIEWDVSVDRMNNSIDMKSDCFRFVPSIELRNSYSAQKRIPT